MYENEIDSKSVSVLEGREGGEGKKGVYGVGDSQLKKKRVYLKTVTRPQRGIDITGLRYECLFLWGEGGRGVPIMSPACSTLYARFRYLG